MVAPLYKFLALSVGAGVGFGLGKGLEWNGKNVLTNAELIRRGALAYFETAKAEYTGIRARVIRKLETFSELIRHHIEQADFDRSGLEEDLPRRLERAWSKILSNTTMLKAFPVTISFGALEADRDRLYHGLAMAARNTQTASPAALAIGAAIATASNGFSYRSKCGEYRVSVRAWAAKVRADCDANVAAIKADVEQLERDWEELITPRLKSALSPGRNARDVGVVLEWARRCEALAKGLGDE